MTLCRNPACKVGEIVKDQYGRESDADFRAREESGYCRPKCRRLYPPSPPSRVSSLEGGGFNHERPELRGVPKEKTVRSEPYKAFIREQRCLLNGGRFGLCEGDIIPHHTASGGMGIKGSDLSCVPLCHTHHHLMDNAGKKGRGIWSRREMEQIITRLNERFNQMQADKRRG